MNDDVVLEEEEEVLSEEVIEKYGPHDDDPLRVSSDESIELDNPERKETLESQKDGSEQKPEVEQETYTKEGGEDVLVGTPVKGKLRWIDWSIYAGIVLVIGGIIWMGMEMYEMRKVVEDPLVLAQKDHEKTLGEWRGLRKKFLVMQEENLKNETLRTKVSISEKLAKDLEIKRAEITGIQREIDSLRADAIEYFDQFKKYSRAKMRKMTFDSITTEKTKKTYMAVSISDVTDNYVSIIHAAGAMKLEPDDLPPFLLDKLAYGDALGLEQMKIEAQAEKQGRAPVKSVPTPKDMPPPVVHKADISNIDFEPPSSNPKLRTPTARDAPATAPDSAPFTPGDAPGTDTFPSDTPEEQGSVMPPIEV